MATKSYYKRKYIYYKPVKNKYQSVVRFLSSWEEKFAKYLDFSSVVESWTHDFPIKYYDRFVSKKMKTYLVDFFVHYKNGEKHLYEVKPKFFLDIKSNSKSSIWRAHHSRNFLLNISKWNAAFEYCQKKKWEFFIVSYNKKQFEFINFNDIKDRFTIGGQNG